MYRLYEKTFFMDFRGLSAPILGKSGGKNTNFLGFSADKAQMKYKWYKYYKITIFYI